MSTDPSVGIPSTFLACVPSIVDPVQTLILDVELSVDLVLKKADPDSSVEYSAWRKEFSALDEIK